MKIATSQQMRKIDREAIEQYGIPGIVLMENAGIKVFNHIMDEDSGCRKRICIICGKGNNGGDGFVVARHLSFKSKEICVYLVENEDELKGDALINYSIAKKMGININYIKDQADLDKLKSDIENSDILIDGLLGTGVRGELKGLYKEVINIINRYASYVVSIDIPSGIDADTGMVLGEGVMADKTVTFALPKIGLYTFPGADYAGEVFIEDISIPEKLIQEQGICVNLLTYEDVAYLLKKRRKDTNKGTYGRACIIAGSKSMMGAAAMCGLSALRCGAGIVELGVPACIQKEVAPLLMEAIVKDYDDDEGILSYECVDKIIESINKSSAYAIGPGLSKSEKLLGILRKVIEESRVYGVIDADGLNILSEDTDMLLKASCTMIVTPHPGEMARLIKKDVSYIQQNRIECAKSFSQKYGVITVLKGANTIISSAEGEVFINTTGNPGMAKGGSGDVLTGMIVSFLSQGIKPFEAAKAAVFIHGISGDMGSCDKGEYSLKAGDIIEQIPYALKTMSCGR